MDFLHVSSSSNNLDHENCDSVWDIKMQTGKRPTATLCQPTHNVGRILTLIYGVEKGKKSSSRIDPCFGITRLPSRYHLACHNLIDQRNTMIVLCYF